MSVVAFIQRCLASGMPLDMALEAAKVFEAEHPAGLSPGALRTRRWREKKAAEASPNVTKASPRDAEADRHQASPSVTKRHAVTPLARVEDKLLTTEVIADADAAVVARDDWPDGDAKVHAAELVKLANTVRLDPHRQLALNTTVGRVHQWRCDGASWRFDVIPVITTIAQKRGPPIGSWKFFDDAIARSIADNRKALEIPAANDLADHRSPQRPPVQGRSRADANFAGAAQALADRRAARAGAGESGDAGGPAGLAVVSGRSG